MSLLRASGELHTWLSRAGLDWERAHVGLSLDRRDGEHELMRAMQMDRELMELFLGATPTITRDDGLLGPIQLFGIHWHILRGRT